MRSPSDRSANPTFSGISTFNCLVFFALMVALTVMPVEAADTPRVFDQGPLPPLGDIPGGPSAAALGLTARAVPAPGPLAACGQFGTPFIASVNPTSIPVGGSATISWCDRSWAYLDGAYQADYYIPYYKVNSGSWTAWPQQTATQTTMSGTGNVSAGSTISFFARAVGREFSLGSWTSKNYDSTTATLQITGGGGGGGGGGGTTKCGQFGTPFVSGLSPSTVNAGQTSTLSWCDPSWAYLDGAFSVDHFDTYYSNNGGSSYTQLGGDVPAAYNGITVHTDTNDTGSTYLFKVLAYGQAFSLGSWTSTSKESTVSQLQVLGSGGGGGGGGSGGGGGGGGGACTSNSTTLCLFSNRFQVTAQYDTYGAPSVFAPATATYFSDNTGFFTTVTPGNVDVVVKMVNFCSLNNTWSAYIGGTTDLGVNLTITDTSNSRVYTKANSFMNPWSLIREVAFTCP